MNRNELGEIAWKTLHDRPLPVGKPRGIAYTNRPANYRELGDLVGSDDDDDKF